MNYTNDSIFYEKIYENHSEYKQKLLELYDELNYIY